MSRGCSPSQDYFSFSSESGGEAMKTLSEKKKNGPLEAINKMNVIQFEILMRLEGKILLSHRVGRDNCLFSTARCLHNESCSSF
jgi:hypothetical protein